MPPPTATAEARRKEIKDYLARHIVNSRKIADAYIRYQDVQYAWSGINCKATISGALHPATPTETEIEVIRSQLLRFLSILVFIDAHEFLNDFRLHFFGRNGEVLCSDSCLPLEDDDIPDFGDFALRQRFRHEQYLFIPEVLYETAAVKQIEDDRRLPFEVVSEDHMDGAYGRVDRVGISPFYFRTRDRDGTYSQVNSEVKYVACKRFHPQRGFARNDARRELDNLQVLKESITSHHNIRLHLAILHHKGEHFILLPWAEHLDLDIFLREGYDFKGTRIYKFNPRFPRIEQGAMINDICMQMHHLAHALEWLHKGITTHGTHQNRIRFAHMDLKPNNVLIDNDDGPSTVGKWVLTDFGISAFKEDDESDSSNLVSVRDYYQTLTINTPPRRDPGAYQPPEVENTDNKLHERRNNAREGRAGRRGDIWSFGCIFSEVLAFSLGQAELVKEFRRARKGRYRNDYFYEKYSHGTLEADQTEMSYRVRPWIIDWLRTLPERYTFPKDAINCCVETILDVLDVDGSRRPKANELLIKMQHVASHVSTARAPGGYPPNCPLERRPSQRPSPPPSPEIPPSPAPPVPVSIPSIKRINTIEEETLLSYRIAPGQGSRSLSQAESVDPMTIASASESQPKLPENIQSPTSRRQDSVADPQSFSPPLRGSVNGLGISHERENSLSTPSTAQTLESGRPTSIASRKDCHGVLIHQDKLRKIHAPVVIIPKHLSERKIVCVSLCSSGRRVAYLTEIKKSQLEIHLYDLLLADRHEQHDGRWGVLANPIVLPNGAAWAKVVLAGDYLVAWGTATRGAKMVYITNRMSAQVWTGSELDGLASLITIAVSRNGSLAFVSSKSIIYTVVEGELMKDPYFREIVRAKNDHSFTHAAFNDDGTLLYAWQFGRPDDCLSVFRIGEFEKKIVLPADSEGSYQSKQQGSPTATIIPYNTYLGCVILAQGDAFFPAQIRSTQRGVIHTLPKNMSTIRNTVAACIYGDHSLLVTEKGLRHTRIWERRIAGGSEHVIEPAGKDPVAELKGVVDKGAQMKVVPVPGTDDLMIVLCTTDGKIIMIPVVAEPR